MRSGGCTRMWMIRVIEGDTGASCLRRVAFVLGGVSYPI